MGVTPVTEANETRPKVTRRKTLRNVGAGAIVGHLGLQGTATALTTGTRGGDTVTIPTVKRRDEVLVREEVPRSWYEHTKQVEQVNSEIAAEFLDAPGVEGVASARSEERFDGKNGLLVEVEVDPDVYDGFLPDSRGGIPIRTTEAGETEFHNCCHHSDYSSVPGGASVHTPAGASGSAGFCVADSEGTRLLLTVNHLWGSCENNFGAILDQHVSEFGEVRVHDEDTDYALVYPTGSDGIGEDVFVNGIRYSVSGYKTESGIASLICDGTTCYQSGSFTCTTSGEIKAKRVNQSNDCVDFEGHGIETNIDTAQGDSGGPYVELVEFSGSQHAVIIGHHSFAKKQSSEVCCHMNCGTTGNPSYGQAFYHLTNSPHDLQLC